MKFQTLIGQSNTDQMSITLGEKLRQAREERGISISEVAEQTRISALYIQSIENDDYRTLPGGIFNKGFVKSYARCVGVDEQEALQDYAALTGSQNIQSVDEPKTRRPQVLTDDNRSSSSLKTIVFAVILVTLIVGGVLALKNYLEGIQTQTAGGNSNVSTNSNANLPNPANDAPAITAAPEALSMSDLRVEVKSLKGSVSISSTSDGTKNSALVTPEKSLSFTPRENLRLSYYKALARNVQMTVNGKAISLPSAPVNPKRNVVEFEINRDNLSAVWQDGKISAVDALPNAPR